MSETIKIPVDISQVSIGLDDDGRNYLDVRRIKLDSKEVDPVFAVLIKGARAYLVLETTKVEHFVGPGGAYVTAKIANTGKPSNTDRITADEVAAFLKTIPTYPGEYLATARMVNKCRGILTASKDRLSGRGEAIYRKYCGVADTLIDHIESGAAAKDEVEAFLKVLSVLVEKINLYSVVPIIGDKERREMIKAYLTR